MSLPVGTKPGRYEIRSQLGIGGMGEVYRATDVKLNRDVAIKVLPETFLNDAERLSVASPFLYQPSNRFHSGSKQLFTCALA